MVQDCVVVLDWCWYQIGGFIGCVIEYDILIVCVFVFVFGGINVLGDMCGLFVQQVGDFNCFLVKFILFIVDIFDCSVCDVRDVVYVFVQFVLIGQVDFVVDDDMVCCGKGFIGNVCFWFFGQKGIKD